MTPRWFCRSALLLLRLCFQLIIASGGAELMLV